MKNFKYDPLTHTITIYKNGLYAVGPDEISQYLIKVEVGNNGNTNIPEGQSGEVG